jgi:hypothetical protein
VQHGAVHALTDLVSKGLMWCWKTLCCAGRDLRPCWGAAMPQQERPEVMLVQFGILWEHSSKRWDSTRNLLGLE